MIPKLKPWQWQAWLQSPPACHTCNRCLPAATASRSVPSLCVCVACLFGPPLTSCPDSVDLYLEDTEVVKVFAYYEDALSQIFQFYASQAEIRTKSEGSPRKGGNTMKEALGYATQ